MAPRSLIFIRHAQSIGNTMTQDQRAECEIPNHSYPLTNHGEQEAFFAALHLSKTLGDRLPDLYFQSTFLRTQSTMNIIQQGLGVRNIRSVITDSRLDEKWDGIFHELSKADIEKHYPEQVRLRKRQGYYHYRAPGGESCPDTEIRIRSFISDPSIDGKNILVVGHGRWFLILQKILHNLSVEGFLDIKKAGLENCSITEYDFTSIGTLPPQAIVPWKGHLAEEDTELT